MKHGFLPALALAALAAGGCAHSRSHEGDATSVAIQIAPAVLATLSGPDGLLLTNTDGFQCRATFTLSDGPNSPRQVRGGLVESQGRLWFESDSVGKKISGRFGILWDTRTGRGYVTSEDLQGVAPVSATNHFEILQREVDANTGAVQDGHPVQTAIVSLFSNNGQTVKRRVWQAADLNALALRIEPLTEGESPAISLSDLQRANPPDGLFVPPDDFTKYASANALLEELLVRQHNVYDEPDPFHGNLGPMLAPGEMSRSPGTAH